MALLHRKLKNQDFFGYTSNYVSEGPACPWLAPGRVGAKNPPPCKSPIWRLRGGVLLRTEVYCEIPIARHGVVRTPKRAKIHYAILHQFYTNFTPFLHNFCPLFSSSSSSSSTMMMKYDFARRPRRRYAII